MRCDRRRVKKDALRDRRLTLPSHQPTPRRPPTPRVVVQMPCPGKADLRRLRSRGFQHLGGWLFSARSGWAVDWTTFVRTFGDPTAGCGPRLSGATWATGTMGFRSLLTPRSARTWLVFERKKLRHGFRPALGQLAADGVRGSRTVFTCWSTSTLFCELRYAWTLRGCSRGSTPQARI